MEIRYALIKAGTVENVIVAEAEFIKTIEHQYDHCELLDAPDEQKVAGLGWRYVDGAFTAPAAIEPITAPRHISVGSFFDLFGPAKWAILADENPSVKAVVKDASVRKHIDLDNPDLPVGLSIVQEAGHSIDPAAIINAVITDAMQP